MGYGSSNRTIRDGAGYGGWSGAGPLRCYRDFAEIALPCAPSRSQAIGLQPEPSSRPDTGQVIKTFGCGSPSAASFMSAEP